ncbi:hypothetical protein [Neolewinella antarctica]|uniref:Uncharacterized protein n=1 Tax=Neolewinella antarctica TaxID=442734 RepID=A0ABX0X9A6_9BACT|nr:hypothetical protein [Neolewinella antarctica]NJC25838.1 hypothetical protein [Neolewinella antarctica]
MEIDWLSAELLTEGRLIFDTAALVLIWLVQRVIYPVFLYARTEDFRVWHPVYTRRVTYVVMPIMLGQVGVYALAILTDPGIDVVANTFLIAAAWAITFFGAVPLHAALDGEATDHRALSTKLININWWRTGTWTLIWSITVINILVP